MTSAATKRSCSSVIEILRLFPPVDDAIAAATPAACPMRHYEPHRRQHQYQPAQFRKPEHPAQQQQAAILCIGCWTFIRSFA